MEFRTVPSKTLQHTFWDIFLKFFFKKEETSTTLKIHMFHGAARMILKKPKAEVTSLHTILQRHRKAERCVFSAGPGRPHVRAAPPTSELIPPGPRRPPPSHRLFALPHALPRGLCGKLSPVFQVSAKTPDLRRCPCASLRKYTSNNNI